MRLLAGEAAVAVDRRQRIVRLASSTTVRYDVLVLATGSSAVLPPVRGLSRADGRPVLGAVAFGTLTDGAGIAERARGAVVLGGGVLGLETARTGSTGPAGDGRPARSAADGTPAVRVRTRVSVAAIRGGDRVRAVELSDGSVLDADLLMLCCGTPREARSVLASLPGNGKNTAGHRLMRRYIP
jgi:NAD(P)H-nitrite reductase large subunit